jgi:hypothetical protein
VEKLQQAFLFLLWSGAAVAAYFLFFKRKVLKLIPTIYTPGQYEEEIEDNRAKLVKQLTEDAKALRAHAAELDKRRSGGKRHQTRRR